MHIILENEGWNVNRNRCGCFPVPVIISCGVLEQLMRMPQFVNTWVDDEANVLKVPRLSIIKKIAKTSTISCVHYMIPGIGLTTND